MRHGRRDANHAAIRDGLRGVLGQKNVLDTADLGEGFPDLVCAWRARTYLLEVKSGPKAKLEPKQAALMAEWRGDVFVRVESLDEALAAIGIAPTGGNRTRARTNLGQRAGLEPAVSIGASRAPQRCTHSK